RKRKSKSNSAYQYGGAASADKSVPLETVASDNNRSHYQSLMSSDSSRSLRPPSNIDASTSDEKPTPPVKSWVINYSDLEMLEAVGEGAFGTVYKAMFR